MAIVFPTYVSVTEDGQENIATSNNVILDVMSMDSVKTALVFA